MDEPLIIGENCFLDATELPAELRDAGIVAFGESGDVVVIGL